MKFNCYANQLSILHRILKIAWDHILWQYWIISKYKYISIYQDGLRPQSVVILDYFKIEIYFKIDYRTKEQHSNGVDGVCGESDNACVCFKEQTGLTL